MPQLTRMRRDSVVRLIRSFLHRSRRRADRFDLWSWAEEDHPRGEGGKFASNGGGAKAEKKKGSESVASYKKAFGTASVIEGKPALGGKVIEKPASHDPKNIHDLHAMFIYHKQMLEHAKQTGQTDKAKQEYKTANNFYNQAKKLVAEKKAAAPKKEEAKPEPKKEAPPKPTAPAPHLEHGNTVKVAGKTESGGPMVGTVVSWSPDGTKTAVLQLGKTEAEWHKNEDLSAHKVNSEWAKQQEKIGQAVAKEIGAGKTEGTINLTQSVKAAQKEHAPKATPQVSAPKEKTPDVVVKGHYKVWAKELAYSEKNALIDYSNSAYQDINNTLRTKGKEAAHPLVKAKIEAIDAALAKAPGLPHDVVLKRGVGGNFPLTVGDTYEDKGFMSTSVGDGFSGSNQFVIKAPKGAKAAYLTMSSHTKEKEVLLPRGSQLKITNIEVKASIRVIHAELIVSDKTDAADNEAPDDQEADDGEQIDLSDNPKFITQEGDLVLVKEGD